MMATRQTSHCSQSRFVRRTELESSEYRRNFHQIDHDIAIAISSAEADRVTPLMSKIYLRLTAAPPDYWERAGVLRFVEVTTPTGIRRTAWAVLCDLLGVSSATASKALKWLHAQAIIGYDARKNGVGIRVFLNRASSSIGHRSRESQQKFLPRSPASLGEAHTSSNEVPFNDTFGVLDISDKLNSPAAKNAAIDPQRALPLLQLVVSKVEEQIGRKVAFLASQALQAEHQKTRDWLEKFGIPKAARVAQNETFKVLRQTRRDPGRQCPTTTYGGINEPQQTCDVEAFGSSELTESDLQELAEISLTMLEMNGQDIGTTIKQLLGDRRSESVDGGRVLQLASEMKRYADQTRENQRSIDANADKGKHQSTNASFII